MNEHYLCHHFSLNLPAGEGQDNIPNLLKHVAKHIEEIGELVEILDITFDVDDTGMDGNALPTATVYYNPVNSQP